MVTRSDRAFSSVPKFLVLVFAAWMIFNLVQTVQYVLADYSGLPMQDYWRVADYWPHYKAFKLSYLWVQHNEHRIVFPEIFFAADMLLLHGRQYLPIAVSALAYLGVWLVLFVAAYSQQVIAFPARELALGLGGTVLVWKGCSTVIAMPFQLQFTLMQFACAMALLCLGHLRETGKRRYLYTLIGAAVVATYCSANGMLIWLVLAGCALLLRIQARHMLTIIVAAAIFAGTYFVGYHFLPSNMSIDLRQPVRAIGFLCSYMSMPFGSFGSPVYGVSLGAINLLLAAGCLALAWRRKLLNTSLGMVLFGSYAFILLSAILTTLGRMMLVDNTFAQAKQVRYLTMPLVAWALIAIALVWLTGSLKSRSWPLIVPVALASFFCWGFYKASAWVEFTRVDLGNAQIVATMLRDGVFDPITATSIFPSADFVRAESELLQAERKSIFARGTDKWIGRNVNSLYPQQKPLAGKVTRVIPIPGGLELIGWADTSAWLGSEHAVLFVDEKNRIAGFGRRPTAGFPPDLNGWDLPEAQAFVGFVSLSNPVSSLSVYVQTFHGKILRPLDGRIDVPVITAAGPVDTAALPGIIWLPDAVWSSNYPVWPDVGSPPPGDSYGSQRFSDVQTGVIRTASFASPTDHCLVLPVLNGRSIYGQSIELQDTDTKQAVAVLPLLEGRPFWKRWRIPIPAATRNVMLVAADEGHEESQWLALGAPRQCP